METMNITVSEEELEMFKAMCEDTAGVNFIEYDLKYQYAKISYSSPSSIYYLGRFLQNASTKKMMGWR